MPGELTPDSFMASQGAVTPGELTPDSFMAGQVKTEDLPSNEESGAPHGAAPGFVDKAKQAASLAAPVTRVLFGEAEKLANAPLVPDWVITPPPKIAPRQADETGPARLEPYTPETVAGGVAHGAAEVVRGMASPENIGLAALIGPLAKISPLLSRGVSAGFGVSMLKNAYDQLPEVRDAIAKKDWPRAAEAITTAALGAGMGATAGVHALRGGPEAPPPAESTPVERATESVRAGVETLSGREGLTPDSFMQQEAPAEPEAIAPKPETPVASAQTPDSFMAQQPESPTQPLWQMSPDELAAAEQEARNRDKNDLVDMFGPEGAQRYTRLERIANSSTRSDAETTAAANEMEGMEGALTEAQRNRLYGIGDDRPQLDDIREYRQALGRLDFNSPEDLGESLKWAATGVGEGDNPAEMTPQQRVRYAQLRYAMTEAQRLGWDPVEISRAAFRGAANRFASPEDAAFMLDRFKQGGEPVAPQLPQLPAPEPPTQARQPSAPPAFGREASILVPGESTVYPARYSVRELADVQPSHNPFSFEPNSAFEHVNDRDYSRSGNAARVVKQASPETFNPEFPTTDSPTAEHGAPIIDASGNVLGGNSRAMTLARVYQRGGPDAAMYRQAIESKAAQFGIDPAELARFEKPILVREVTGGVDAQKAITDFNKAAAAELTPEERAVSDGRRLSPDTIAKIGANLQDLGDEGTLAEALRGDNGAEILQSLVKDGVLTDQEKVAYLDDRGNLTADAKARIARALVGRMFETPAEYRETTPSMRAKLERVAPQLLRVEGRPDWSLTDTTRQAIALIEDARVHKMPIEDTARQAGIGEGGGYSQDAIALAKTLEQGPVKAAGAFRRYANDEALSREGSQSAFFEPPTRAEAFRDAFLPLPVEGSRVPKIDEETRNAPYVTGASTFFHGKLTKLKPIELSERESKSADAYATSISGLELVGRAAGRPDDVVGATHAGLHIAPGLAGKLARNLAVITRGKFPGALPQGVTDLIAAAQKAADAGKSLILVADHASLEEHHDNALAEELAHAMQASLGGRTSEHLGAGLHSFLSSPVALKAAVNLADRYSDLDAGSLATEIGVRLMRPGGAQELGLSPAEARTLGAHYVRTLGREYGHAAVREIGRQVIDTLKPLRGGSQDLADEPGTKPAGLPPEGGAGPSGGDGSDVSGYRPGDRGLRRRDDRGAGQEADDSNRSLFPTDEQSQLAGEAEADRARLEGERLTAQFNAPVSREEQLRKLRPGEQPQQTGFFEETPEKQQFSLFGNERGGVSPDLLSLGAGKFVQHDVIPAAKRVASDLAEAKDDIMRVVAPQTRGSAAELTGLNLRQRMAQFARRFDQGEQRLRDARKFFNSRTPEQNYDFIDRVEQGLGRGAQGELEPIARMFANMLDQRRREVQALGEGALKAYYQNYFPHIFERPEQASKFVESFFGGKRTMEGPKSFLKHRDFPTFREALEAGLKPVSDNPVDLVLMKAREMDRYLLAHAVLRDLAEHGIAKRVSGLGSDARQAEMLGGAPIRPEWAVEKKTDLPPNFLSIRDPVGGGKWYAEEGAADVLNNFLSPGLRARSGAFRTLLGLNNVMNQANLGLSAFHLRAVTISSMASRMGLGVVKALEGHPLDAGWHILTSPAAPFIDYLRGSEVLREWFKPGSEGAPVAAVTDALMKGGGRARMDPFYQNAIAEKMMQSFRRGNFIGGALRSPFAAIEATSKPLMNFLVPRMKLGAFADIAQHEMEKLGPGARVEDVQRAMSQAWDHVEYRLGQMTYDNRFWNRTFKDIAMLSVRSVGWNLGDFLEAKSATRALRQMATGKMPYDPHGLGFVVGYTIAAALMGATMQYLHTGQGPRELRDYFFPRREDGRRVVSAPYAKDVYQFARDPSRTIENKASPLITTMAEMFNNRDYYDRPIHNPDDPLVKQLKDEAEFVGRQFLPFTIQQMEASHGRKQKPLPGGNTPEHKVENFLGVNPAPAALQPGYKPRRRYISGR